MTITFAKYLNTVRIVIDGSSEVGSVEVLSPPLASRLFAESHMPAVGDAIIFDAPFGPAEYVDSRKVQGQDMPKTTAFGPSPTTYVFAVANGPSAWTVSVVGQDDSVTIVRGET